MRSILVSLTLLLIVSSRRFDVDDDVKGEFNEEFESQALKMADDDPRRQVFLKALVHHKACNERQWACKEGCHAQIKLSNFDSLHCKKPLSEDSCFGVPIDYPYVPSRKVLPVEYEVLRRFPKCWSELGPMLCGIIYRPCGVYGTVHRMSTTEQPMELYQRFNVGWCTKTREHCRDAIKEGLFPSDLIDCTRTVGNKTWEAEKTSTSGLTQWERDTVFTDKCSKDSTKISYTQKASRHEKMQCIFPLVHSQQLTHISPVIDECYLPCRNPLISSPYKFLSFRIVRAFLCFAVAATCLSIFFFLAVRSLIFVQSDVIFSIACSLLSLAVYLISWGIGSIGYLAEASECTYTNDGVALRNTKLELPWCWLSAFASHVSLLVSIGFLSAAYALSTAAATKAAAHEEKKEKSGDDSFSSLGIRFYLVAGISIVSITIGLIAAGLDKVSTDGVAGVCSLGLHSFLDHLAFVAGPGLLYCLIGLGWGAREIWREKKHQEAEISQEIEEKIHEAIEHEKSKEKVDYLNERGPNWKEEVLEHIRRGSQPPSIEDKTETRGSTEGGAVEERKEKVEEGEDEITTLTTVLIPEDEDEQKEWLSEEQKVEIRETVLKERQEQWRDRQTRAWHEGISSRYTLLALCICILSIIFGLVFHNNKLANDGHQEFQAVRNYVTCVMVRSLSLKKTHWLSQPHHAAEMWANGTAEADPLVRRSNLASEVTIHDCVYPSTGDGRMFGLMLVFVVFPLLPVLVFIWAFFEGLSGAGGMKKVRERRQKAKLAELDDVEMGHLTMERDDDSQMMSSVCSSMGDHPYYDHNAASSTVSTRLSSAASAASSTHTSVSLRGALPRFPSTERLMTVHATPPVPSVAQTVPDRRRSRSAAPHHRTLDVMGRMRERRERIGKMKKKRTSSAELNARREGVAESGQFVPRDDARSVHSQATVCSMLSGAASSYLAPPSEVGRAMVSNAEAFLRREAREAAERGAGMQERLQLLQEELVLRALPRDEARDAASQQQNDMDWIGRLSAVREILGRYQQDDVYAHVAYRGFFLSGQTIALARIAYDNGTIGYHSNVQALLFALERVDRLAHFIENRLAPSPELAADIEEGATVISRQIELNGLPNARMLLFQQNFQIVLDVNNPERVAQRAMIIAESPPSEERQGANPGYVPSPEVYERVKLALAEMLLGTNRRYVQRMAERARVQQQLLQQAVRASRTPVYAPQHTVDLRLPPDGVDARSEVGSSFSMTNSTVPSSAMTTHNQNGVARLYHDTHHQPPPDYVGPSTSTSSSNSRAAAAAAANGANGDAAHLPAFIAAVMRTNPAMAHARLTDHFPVPTTSSNGLNDSHVADDDDDVMSSETSMDSIGRRTAPSVRRYENAGGFFVPVVEVQQQSSAASAAGLQQQQQTNVPRRFPFLPPNGAQLPPSLFPDAQSLTREELEEVTAAPASASGINPLVRVEQTRSDASTPQLELPDAPNGELPRRPENQKKRKTMAVAAETTSSCQASRRRHSPDEDDSAPPPAVNRVFVQEQPGSSNGLMAMPLDGLTAATREGGGGRRAADEEEEEGGSVADSGIDSLASINSTQGWRPVALVMRGEDGAERTATSEEFLEWRRRMEGLGDVRTEEEEMDRDEWRRRREDGEGREEAAPSSDEERRRRRLQLRNVHLHHSDPDLAMAEEEERIRRQRDMEDYDEKWEREQMAIAEARRLQRERERAAPVVDQHANLHGSQESISSLLTAEQQVELVRQLRDALEHRSTDGMEPEHRRLVEHLRLALDTQGGISREEIMRYRVMETNREARERQDPDRNSPYSVSSVVISRLSLAEIGARVDAIRALSDTTLYPLEVYYQLHLADVLWPLAGRDVMLGDNVYTHDEINRVLGADSPVVPEGWNSDDFHQLMRKRAITSASLTGRSYGRSRGTEGPQYEPPRLPDMGLYRTFQDPSVLQAAIGGDLEPIRRAIESLQLTMPDVMRLDNRSEHTLGSHLRHFRDYLDERARAAGYAPRADTYTHDAVPQEPTGSRTLPTDYDDDEEEDAPDPSAKPSASDPEF